LPLFNLDLVVNRLLRVMSRRLESNSRRLEDARRASIAGVMRLQKPGRSWSKSSKRPDAGGRTVSTEQRADVRGTPFHSGVDQLKRVQNEGSKEGNRTAKSLGDGAEGVVDRGSEGFIGRASASAQPEIRCEDRALLAIAGFVTSLFDGAFPHSAVRSSQELRGVPKWPRQQGTTYSANAPQNDRSIPHDARACRGGHATK